MKRQCPEPTCAVRESIIRDGYYKRKDDSKVIQRFRCLNCGRRFSSATFSEAFRQKRRRINSPLLKLFSSNVSQRRAAILLNVNRKTIEKRLPFLANKCRRLNQVELQKFKGRVFSIQIDDLVTKENSKLKPLTVSIAVDEDRRRILAVEVSKIPAFGHLSKIALKKYGHRRDEHFEGLTRLFQTLSQIASDEAIVKSDEHQRYPGFISTYLPRSKHFTFKSERSCIAGQGELKKIHFDPLFTINHTCAMLRGSVNRLNRKTWCTTKHPERLKDHLDIFIYFYNEVLLTKTLTPL